MAIGSPRPRLAIRTVERRGGVRTELWGSERIGNGRRATGHTGARRDRATLEMSVRAGVEGTSRWRKLSRLRTPRGRGESRAFSGFLASCAGSQAASRKLLVVRENATAFRLDAGRRITYLLICRRDGRLDRRHPTRKGRPGTRKGEGSVRPGAPRERRRRLRKGPPATAFGSGPGGRATRRTALVARRDTNGRKAARTGGVGPSGQGASEREHPERAQAFSGFLASGPASSVRLHSSPWDGQKTH